MGKNKNTKSSKQKSSSDGWTYVDPSRVRFQHSRIRPYFSGCGRKVTDTLEQIRRGEISVSDLPPIQVIVGPPDKNDEPWYFSLNNRRLWVLKRCKEEGLINENNGLVKVRVREPKSSNEYCRYSVDKCALEAKFIRERPPSNNVNSEQELASTNVLK